MSVASKLGPHHEEVVAFLLDAEAARVRPGRPMIADHLGLTDRKTRTILGHLTALDLIESGEFSGGRGGYAVKRSNPTLLLRLTRNAEARRAMASNEVVSLDQLAILTAGAPLLSDVDPEHREAVREALAGVSPADERYGLYWATDAYQPLVERFGAGWWAEPPKAPLHRLVLECLQAVQPGSGWRLADASPANCRFDRSGSDADCVRLELALPFGAYLSRVGADSSVLDVQIIETRTSPASLKTTIRSLLG